MADTYRSQTGTAPTGLPAAGAPAGYPPGDEPPMPYPDDQPYRQASQETQPYQEPHWMPGISVTTAEESRPSTGQLVSGIVSDISTLFRQEIALAKAEMRQEAARAGKGAGMLGGAGIAGLFALLFVLVAVMFAFGTVMSLGWAALIVGALLTALAGTLALLGRRTMRKVHPTPSQTMETIREDIQFAQGRR